MCCGAAHRNGGFAGFDRLHAALDRTLLLHGDVAEIAEQPASYCSGLWPRLRRVGEHALCSAHVERLVHKLVPANDKQRNAVEVARRMIRWFYRAPKEFKLAPGSEKAERLRAQLDRIFNRSRTG